MEILVSILVWILIAVIIIGIPLVLVRIWLHSLNIRKRALWLSQQSWQLLLVQVPKENEKSPLAAEQMFAALHGVLRADPAYQEFFSFEIVAQKNAIRFYIFVPAHLRDFVEGQIYAQYPEVVIEAVPDYTTSITEHNLPVASAELGLTKVDFYPIKTFPDFEVDPIAGVTSVLTKLDDNEEIWLQVVIKPVSESWHKKGMDFVKNIKEGGKTALSFSIATWFVRIVRFIAQVFIQAIDPKNTVSGISRTSSEKPDLPGPVKEALEGAEKKITKLGFETRVRIIAVGRDETSAKTRVQSMIAAFKQFNTNNKNGFTAPHEVRLGDVKAISDYCARNIEEGGYVLNIEELASVYHFPSQSVKTPSVAWSGAKTGEAPANLPLKDSVSSKNLTVIGRTNFRNIQKEFGIKLDDRRRHIYIIGKSGVGKSVLLENMILDDINEDRGVIVVDPHGDLADKVLSLIPRRRIDDAIVFDPSDREFPIAFNLLESVNEDYKGTVASGFVGIFKKIFGYSWGPRLEHILRNTVLALLDVPDSTMIGIPKMLTDQKYRDEVLEYVEDPVIQDFWINEFNVMDNRSRTEAVGPVLNKVGQFLSTPTIRNIVGQPRSSIDIRDVMDNEKILIVNLSRGKIGEDNTALMGAMMITKVQLAAMSRANVPESQRPDCFLFVDEFQNFATESFATILSEARKYHLGLTVANQYIAQMSEEVRDAVFGNAGTIISFRVGAQDAEFLVKEFEPVFTQNDLVNLEKYHIYIKLLIDGIAADAFSASTLPPAEVKEDCSAEIKAMSRRKYAQHRQVVESQIEKMTGIRERIEARRAAKEATKVLEKAAEALNTSQTVPELQTSSESPLPQSMSQGGGEQDNLSEAENDVGRDGGGTEQNDEKKRKELKIIGSYIYKQYDQKGGKRWFLPEKIEDELARERQKKEKKSKGI